MSEQQLPPQGLLVPTGMLAPGFSQSALQGTLTGAASTVSQLALRVVQYIQSVLADAVNTGQSIALKVATPIAAGVNQAQAALDQIGGQVKSQIQAGLASATASCQSGCASESGAKPGQYVYNVWQDFDAPNSVAFREGSTLPPSTNANWCFRGGWDSYYDALTFKGQIQGSTPPSGCAKPGGPATVVTTPVDPCQQWPMVLYYGKVIAGQEYCWIAPQSYPEPDGYPLGIVATTPDQLTQDCRGVPCGVVEGPCASLCSASGGATGQQWDAGCLGSQIVTWIDGTPPPTGVTNVVGPYPTQAQAQAAAQCGVTPPPPPGCQQVQLCSAVDVNLPKCLEITFCDWDKLHDTLLKVLCDWYEQCVCKLDNQTSYQLSDCDGTLGTALTDWLGSSGQVISLPADEIVGQAQAVAGVGGYESSGNGDAVPGGD